MRWWKRQSVPIEIALEVISRVKVLARMDIAERRAPQDGQLTLAVQGDGFTSRPRSRARSARRRASYPRRPVAHPFDKLGLEGPVAAVEDPHRSAVGLHRRGKGPTGAGKTSTLYACIGLLDTRHTNVITLEDPIEIEMPSITQGQTNVKAGFTFATGLRAILRQIRT